MPNTNNQFSFLDYTGLSLFWSKVKKIIEDNELVTATALTDLDTRVDNLEDAISDQIISKTYTELKTLRDNGQLVPGQQYRITDYTCTTMQSGTRSAGHAFDIVVTADDENTLNEVARAVKHDGDTYFANNDLNVWQIWYCLDNDTNRFAWAMMKGKYIGVAFGDTSTYVSYAETKVINDVTYELWSTPDPTFYIGTKTLEVGEYCDAISIDEGGSFIVAMENFASISDIKEVVEDGKGVIYRMIDEFGNDCPYDFKNIQFYRQWDETKQLWSTILQDSTGIPCYTFSSEGDSSTAEFTDMSLIMSSQVYGNIIKAYASGVQMLNNNCFFGTYCNLNTFGNDCYGNVFGNGCYDNAFGNSCNSNAFGNDCSSNAFGNSCYNNAFGNSCYNNAFGNNCNNNAFGNNCNSNAFGNDCDNNAFGNDCSSNAFGNSCYGNAFGNDCQSNAFGNNCDNNAFGNGCYGNAFGNGCYGNAFGNGCNNNSFGNSCNSNAFGNRCYGNAFGNSCTHNVFGEYCSNNAFGNNCGYIKFAADSSASTKYNYYQYNHFGDGCRLIVFTGAETASALDQVQNYNFAQGLQGTSNADLIIDGKRNQAYETKVAKNSNGELVIYCEADLIMTN